MGKVCTSYLTHSLAYADMSQYCNMPSFSDVLFIVESALVSEFLFQTLPLTVFAHLCKIGSLNFRMLFYTEAVSAFFLKVSPYPCVP